MPTVRRCRESSKVVRPSTEGSIQRMACVVRKKLEKGVRMDSINIVSSYADKLSALEAEVESLSLEELKEYWFSHEAKARIPGVGSKNCQDVIKLFKIVKG